MDEVETEFLKTEERTPLIWFRYIDDIFFIWSHGKEHLKTFYRNSINLILIWNLLMSRMKRDTIFRFKGQVNEGKISTDLYINFTDRHQYLHFASSHPNHTRMSIVYSQGLRVKRIYSENWEDVLKQMREMKLWFLKRGYLENIVDQEQGKVKFSELSPRTNKRNKGVCLAYHPLLQNIDRIFIDILIYFILNKKLK